MRVRTRPWALPRLTDRRRAILAHMALWERSRKRWAPEELAYWQAELEHLDREAAG